jgi:DNA-directed RNA polymerase specialized sigma24 family protein
VHAQLARWGRWASQRSKGGSSIASLEALCRRVASPPATAPLTADPALVAIERAVITLPAQHRDTIVYLYVRRFSAHTICRKFRLRFEDFARWVHDCRAMVLARLADTKP